ncbi:Caffeine-induced death protein 2 [Erysiphe neolycopersici]|uniref:Caffeine-induced death protein 2 n=1 Tax=Erysiphe neolycopersici TaxID=212602 RepID=A0A420HFM1_9PEZI|nr:Caffeine-induced death protein 2 [Erysiphe neolycopersici]
MDRLAPTLTPELCISTRSLRDFLRVSRGIDDGIIQHLNSLLTQSKSDFNPSSSSLIRLSRSGSKHLPSRTCQKFTQQVVFPSWNSRDKILQYCKSVATNMVTNESNPLLGNDDQIEVVDDHLDPYSTRSSPTQTEAQMLSDVLRLENRVEDIIRNRTWEVICERCDLNSKCWKNNFSEWKRQQGESDEL